MTKKTDEGLDRRDFLKAAGAGAGLSVAGAGSLGATEREARPGSPRPSQNSPDIVVIGAGAFGVWTAYYLREMGAHVTLVDTFGPGNSRSTSGGETRGVRTSYGDHELRIRWANDAIQRWLRWDAEWGRELNIRLFFQTGDLILRPNAAGWLEQSMGWWDKLGVPYEILTREETTYRYPQVALDGMEHFVVEPNAGVVRARRACEAVSTVYQRRGGNLVTAHARLGDRAEGKLQNISLTPGTTLSADAYVFACGPWLPKVLPEAMANKIRTSMGHVYYFGTPSGDNRFTYPNMPSYNVPGVTGWAALPPDHRGFRVRTGGRRPSDPDESERWIDPENFERPRNFVAERFPALKDMPIVETRACHYESSTDRNFIVDSHPDLSNVWIAGGGSSEGFKFGPVIGEYVAKRVLGDEGDPALVELFKLKDAVFPPPEEEPERRR